MPDVFRLVAVLAAAASPPGQSESGPERAAVAATATSDGALGRDALVRVLATIDDRQRNGGDYRAQFYLERKERGKADLVYDGVVYRRDADDKLMILFTRPKSEAGKGYLRIDKNLWMYDPTVGKWDRRTERERIGGTDSRRADFDESRLAEEYEPMDEGDQRLGAFTVRRIALTAREGADVAFPVVKLWVDLSNNNVLKRQEFALSGRLMRTLYYPKWSQLFSESKRAEVWFPREIRIYDEVDKANSSLILLQAVDLRSLDLNLFTKAWLESKSR